MQRAASSLPARSREGSAGIEMVRDSGVVQLMEADVRTVGRLVPREHQLAPG